MTFLRAIRLVATALAFVSPIALQAAPKVLSARQAADASPEALRDALLAALANGTTIVSSYAGFSHPVPTWSANVSLRQVPMSTPYSGICVVNQINISADADNEQGGIPQTQYQRSEPGLKFQRVSTYELFRIVGSVPGVSFDAFLKQDSAAGRQLQPDCSKVDPQEIFFRVEDWSSGNGGETGAATAAYLLQEAFKRTANSDISFESSCGNVNCFSEFQKLDVGRISEVSLGECRKDGVVEAIRECTEYRIKFFESVSPSGLSGKDSHVVLWAKQKDSTHEPILSKIYFGRGQWVS